MTEGAPTKKQGAAKKNGQTSTDKLPLSDDRMVWTKAETKDEIVRLENQLTVAYKQHIDEVSGGVTADQIEQDLIAANDSFSQKQDIVDAQDRLIKIKSNLNVIISKLTLEHRLRYLVSIWGVIPFMTAGVGLTLSFIAIILIGTKTVLSVPLWAVFIAVIGACVQIFVGVVNDYKSDGQITNYKRLWYVAIIPASFAFGFVAFLLVQAGLINITQGQFVLNQALNQTITTVTQTGNQTVTQATTPNGIGANLAAPLIVCFLAGYATDWFIGLLGKLIPSK